MLYEGVGWSAFRLTSPRRDEPEDVFRIEQLEEECLLAVLCDGHGCDARACAQAVCDELPDLVRAFGPRQDREEEMARQVCRELDALLAKNFDGGTTLTFSLLSPGQLFLAWVGDTRGTLVNGTRLRTLTRDHVLDNEWEAAAARARGATVRRGRISTSTRPIGLMLSRSLGDVHYGDMVSHEPDCVRVDLRAQDMTRLHLGTDGVWGPVDEAGITNRDLVTWLQGGTEYLLDRLRGLQPSDDATSVDIDLQPFI